MKELAESRKECCLCDGICDIDFSGDNGYKYVLDELKATRAHIDSIINVIEKRIEKDAIIDEVLNTDYGDEKDELKTYCDDDKEVDEENKKTKDETILDEIIKVIAISNAMNNISSNANRENKYKYPWWSVYPSRLNTWF